MGQSTGDSGNSTGRMLTSAALSGAAGGFNAASGTPQAQQIDFSGLAKRFKKKPNDPIALTDNPSQIAAQGPSVAPNFSYSPTQPMPDLSFTQQGMPPIFDPNGYQPINPMFKKSMAFLGY